MEGAPIDPLEKKFRFLPRAQRMILIDARKLKGGRFERGNFDQRVEIGTAVEIIKKAINDDFGIDVDDIRINGMRGNHFRIDRNGGYIDMEYPTGIQNVLLVFTYNSREELARHSPSSTALVIKGEMGKL